MIASVAALDMSVLQHLFAQRDTATTLAFIGISELGSTLFVCGIALCVGLLLALRHKVPSAIGLAVSVLGGGATALLIKELVHRARPEAIFQAYQETGFSFPSGHATLAAAAYGFFISLAWCMMPAGNKRSILVAALTLLIALIAFSRLYLGVHYLTDIVGGLLVGILFVYIGNFAAQKMRKRN